MPSAEASAEPAAGPRLALTLALLVATQVGLHGCLNGMRMAVPLRAAHEGLGAVAIGGLMALFAAFPFLIAIPAGRLADRRGYHLPVRLAALLAFAGSALATAWPTPWLLGPAAALVGAGSAIGMIALQRTAGRLAQGQAQRLRVFSWVALAPSIATLVGPLLAGTLIDHAGWRAAFGGLALLPLLSLAAAVRVPREALAPPPPPPTPMPAGPAAAASPPAAAAAAWDLLRHGDFRRLLFINWLIAACWDAHAFALPLLGHERGLSATSIGLVLSSYAVSSAAVRGLIPFVAERLQPRLVMAIALALCAAVFIGYPVLHSAWAMAACAAALGLGLGAIQPAVMSTLHTVAPPGRQGEALGLRSSVIHFSALVMPLGFGAIGAALGVGPVFWLTGLALSAGAWQAWRLPRS